MKSSEALIKMEEMVKKYEDKHLHLRIEREIRFEIENPPLELSELTKDHIGKLVCYTNKFERGNEIPFQEHGYITSWNEKFIFVCFDAFGRGKSCKPSSLSFPHRVS